MKKAHVGPKLSKALHQPAPLYLPRGPLPSFSPTAAGVTHRSLRYPCFPNILPITPLLFSGLDSKSPRAPGSQGIQICMFKASPGLGPSLGLEDAENWVVEAKPAAGGRGEAPGTRRGARDLDPMSLCGPRHLGKAKPHHYLAFYLFKVPKIEFAPFGSRPRIRFPPPGPSTGAGALVQHPVRGLTPAPGSAEEADPGRGRPQRQVPRRRCVAIKR